MTLLENYGFQKWVMAFEEINKKHGGPFDRGGADFYYHRDFDPHYWPEGTGNGTRVEQKDMTLAEQAEYLLGWTEQTEQKIWD